jgi:hypothetical protein
MQESSAVQNVKQLWGIAAPSAMQSLRQLS